MTEFNDYHRVVFGLRRQIKRQEKTFNYFKGAGMGIRGLRMYVVKRRALLKVLLAYQLATFQN